MATTIRRAEERDVTPVSRIWHEGWRDAHEGRVPQELYRFRTAETYPDRVRTRLPHTWVAERDGEVIGFVVVIDDELEQLYVDAAARGTGAARDLMDAALTSLRESGSPRAWLAVVAENARARAFYEKSGWVDAGPIDYDAEVEGGTVAVPCRRYERAL
jgi:putative acetyltransferase